MLAQQREIVLDVVAVFLRRVGGVEGRVDAERRHAGAVEAALELVHRERGDEPGERRGGGGIEEARGAVAEVLADFLAALQQQVRRGRASLRRGR